jgi:cephalosporin hydroxylase
MIFCLVVLFVYYVKNLRKIYYKNKMSLVDLVDNSKTDKNTCHSYLPLYDELLLKYKNSAKDIIEIGVQLGGSIKLWNDYFSNAIIHAVDNEKKQSFAELRRFPRIKIYLEDAYCESFVQSLPQMDFIIDDGDHSLKSLKFVVQHYSKILKDDGILIIEDVQDIKWLDDLRNACPPELQKCIKTYDLRKNKNRYDDIVFVIDKSIK